MNWRGITCISFLSILFAGLEAEELLFKSNLRTAVPEAVWVADTKELAGSSFWQWMRALWTLYLLHRRVPDALFTFAAMRKSRNPRWLRSSLQAIRPCQR